MTIRLGLLEEELTTCVGCGLCLPHCPTFRATGEEALSPRGRIAAMRDVQWGGADVSDEFVGFMETCVQCRGCEPACPSGVPFGHLMEGTRAALATAGRVTPWWQRIGYGLLGHHRLLLAGSSALAVIQRLHLVPARAGLPRLSLRRGAKVRSGGSDAWLFTGCVMDAWYRDVHRASARVLQAMGVRIAVPGSGGGCCGALHTHAGLHDTSQALARRVMESMPGAAPILVNSAGCGAALKEYGHLLGTGEASEFSARVFDIQEWIAAHGELLPTASGRAQPVIVQDPCHLRHVQRAHLGVRQLLNRVGVEVVELDDDGLCCGAGGAYSALQPGLAGQIRERKLVALQRATDRSGVRAVVSANPGCSAHLAARGVEVRHPMLIVEEALWE